MLYPALLVAAVGRLSKKGAKCVWGGVISAREFFSLFYYSFYMLIDCSENSEEMEKVRFKHNSADPGLLTMGRPQIMG